MSGVRREGQANRDGRSKATFRPSAPILLVAAAVVLIAVTTDLSRSGLHPSLPAAVTLPTPSVGPLGPPAGTDREPATDPVAPADGQEPTGTPRTTSPYHHPPTAVSPSYPVGTLRPAGTGTPAASGSAAVADPEATTTTLPDAATGSEGGYPDSSRDTTETVPPNYPVVTSPPSPTTTSTPTSSTTDR